MRLTIDTEADTYEQTIAAVQAAFGLRPAVPAAWPDAPAAVRRPGPQDLADDALADGWTDQLLFHMIASLVPGARAILRRITELGGTAPNDGQRAYDWLAAHEASSTHQAPLESITKGTGRRSTGGPPRSVRRAAPRAAVGC
ncbi:hypothetical protein [Streptomyces shenzhenensis]|uniref:hypothetical protein n=1 Tax=Streptomyces shenzhenensis TaxID=943815 RepID=UPI001F3ED8E0|nr:hypothetical protein [Streptomyces shenzhenensis]